MPCRSCGSENIETIRRPDSLRCMYPNDKIVDRCADCGDVTSRAIKDVLAELLEHYKNEEADDEEDAGSAD